MIFKQSDEVYTSKYIERTPHYIYFTTWSLINLRSSGRLSAISIAYESNCSATRLSGGLAANFSIKDSAPECKDSLLPVSGGYPQLPHLTQHPSGLQELHALLHHLVQDGQDGQDDQYVGLHLCVRLHLERKQRWLSKLEGESKVELGTSSEHLQKLGSFDNFRQQFLMTISGWAPWTQDHRSCQPGQRFQSQCDSQDSRSYLDTVSHPGRKLG